MTIAMKRGPVMALLGMVLTCLGLWVPAVAQDEAVTLSPEQQAQEYAAINAELEGVAKEIAALLKHPGFRGQLRGEINGANTVESIIVLDKFLAKVTKQKKSPPGLNKARGATDKAAQRIKASPAWDLEGIDLYFPVEDHKAKWKGNEDLIVAYSPAEDEDAIKSIIGFSVKTQQRVTLDANGPPPTPVLMVAPEEHASHDMPVVTRDLDDVKLPSDEVKDDLVGRDPPPPEVDQPDSNSRWGIRYLKLYKDGEHWSRGKPEVYVQLFQVSGNTCYRKISSSPYVDRENVWYHTWNDTRYANPPSWMDYNSNYENRVLMYINESDGGYYQPYHWSGIKDGVTCVIWRRNKDDRIDHSYMYKTYFKYNYNFYHHIGDAHLVWYKHE